MGGTGVGRIEAVIPLPERADGIGWTKNTMLFEETELLKIAYEIGGPASGKPVFLLHGWPDAPSGWEQVARRFHEHGLKTIAPYLRGSYPTEFRSPSTPRFAGAVAIAQDTIDLADKLGIERFVVVGHDWGARIAYSLAALFPERIEAIAALALAYQPRGEFHIGDFAQSMRFWYQFFQCTDAGAAAVRHDPVGFARVQWETWSPQGWFTEEDFQVASRYFDRPDWSEITLNAYRSRYLSGETFDPRYAELQTKLSSTTNLAVPTLMMQGGADLCDLPSGSEGQEKCFLNGYERIVLEGVGHFPHRESPDRVAALVLRMPGLK